MQIGNPGRTIEQYFHDVVAGHIDSSSRTCVVLQDAFLGRSKDNLDQIDMGILLCLAVTSFGGYLRYVTSQRETPAEKSSRTAFEVMMASQRQLCLRKLPAKKKECNSKDRLYNLVELLQEKDVAPTEVDHVGVNLVKTLVECLWYIDGRHSNFERHSSPIPDVFSRFTGFNVPESQSTGSVLLATCNMMFCMDSTNLCLVYCKHPSGNETSGKTSVLTYLHLL